VRFDGSTENLMAIAHLVAQEQLCCPFLQVQLLAEKGRGSLWLEVTGSNDAVQVLLDLFGFDYTNSSDSSYGAGHCQLDNLLEKGRF
jgi:ribosomal protein S18 acetylase RimI-like enzyme